MDNNVEIFRTDLYISWLRILAGTAVAGLATAWLAEHVWQGFALVAFFLGFGGVYALGQLAWWMLEDARSWWRTRPPEFVVRNSKFFYFAEPIGLALVGAALYFFHWFVFPQIEWLRTVGWVVLFIGTCWLLVRTEASESFARIAAYQFDRVRELDPASIPTAARIETTLLARMRRSVPTLLRVSAFIAVLTLPSAMCWLVGCPDESDGDDDEAVVIDCEVYDCEALSGFLRPD